MSEEWWPWDDDAELDTPDARVVVKPARCLSKYDVRRVGVVDCDNVTLGHVLHGNKLHGVVWQDDDERCLIATGPINPAPFITCPTPCDDDCDADCHTSGTTCQ